MEFGFGTRARSSKPEISGELDGLLTAILGRTFKEEL
jgi:hypothetical protein